MTTKRDKNHETKSAERPKRETVKDLKAREEDSDVRGGADNAPKPPPPGPRGGNVRFW